MTWTNKDISKRLRVRLGNDHLLPKSHPWLLRKSCPVTSPVSGASTSQTRWLLRSLLSSAAVMGKRTVWILCPDPMGGFLHGFGRRCERRRQARSLRGPSAPRSGPCWLRNARRGGCTRTLSLSSIQHSNVWGQNKFQQASISQLRISTLSHGGCAKWVLTCSEREKEKEEGNLEKRNRKAGNLKIQIMLQKTDYSFVVKSVC